jgi:hypothetical protein
VATHPTATKRRSLGRGLVSLRHAGAARSVLRRQRHRGFAAPIQPSIASPHRHGWLAGLAGTQPRHRTNGVRLSYFSLRLDPHCTGISQPRHAHRAIRTADDRYAAACALRTPSRDRTATGMVTRVAFRLRPASWWQGACTGGQTRCMEHLRATTAAPLLSRHTMHLSLSRPGRDHGVASAIAWATYGARTDWYVTVSIAPRGVFKLVAA